VFRRVFRGPADSNPVIDSSVAEVGVDEFDVYAAIERLTQRRQTANYLAAFDVAGYVEGRDPWPDVGEQAEGPEACEFSELAPG
jgi:hypothetical protein